MAMEIVTGTGTGNMIGTKIGSGTVSKTKNKTPFALWIRELDASVNVISKW